MKGSIEKVKHRLENVDNHLSECQSDAKEENLAAKHSRTGMRKQFQDEMKSLTELANKRIDIVKQDLKDFQKENANEIKTLNDQITAIKTDTSEIKGMVQMLVAKGGK
jgi:DNA repair exonuclease SbcCD ATPase subunit